MTNVAEHIVERLVASGITRVFAYPGDAMHPLLAALEAREGDIDLVQAADEEAAAFMACGHAKLTGEVAACLVSSGSAATRALTGLWDAHLDHQGVLAIVGVPARTTLGGHYREEIELVPTLASVAPSFVQTITTPGQARHVIDRAARTARAERLPACVIAPVDVQVEKATDPPHAHDSVHSGPGFEAPIVVPSEDALARAAAVLNAGQKVAMLVGAGARDATDEVIAVAERLGAGVAKALLGKATVPDDLPFVTGGIGLLGTRPSYTMMQACDTLLVVGSRFPYAEFLPEEGQARGVQIDLDARMLSLRYPMEIGLVGDAKATLRALLPRLEPRESRTFRDTVERDVAAWWEKLARRAAIEADPINPERVLSALSARLPDAAMLACDAGNSVHWFSRHLRVRRGMAVLHSGFLSAMGSSIPYALAAKLAHPDRPAIAVIGDGAMQMRGLAVLFSVAKHRARFADPRFIVLVLNDAQLNMDVWEKRVLRGEPAEGSTHTIERFAYAAFAEQLGLRGIQVTHADAVEDALDAALASDRPVVLDVHVDPKVPPIPPRVSLTQAANLAKAMLAGDKQALAAIRLSLAELFA